MLRASEILYGTIGPTTEGWKEAWSQSVLSTWMESSTRGQNCLCSCRKGLSEITAPPNVQGLLSHSYCWTISHLLPREVVELPSLEAFRNVWMWHLGTGFSGEHGSAGNSCIPWSGKAFPTWTILWLQLTSPTHSPFRLGINPPFVHLKTLPKFYKSCQH